MNLTESLAVLGLSVVLLFLIRGRNGDAIPIFQKLPWVVGVLSAMAVFYLFLGGLMGVATNLHWL